MSGTVYLSICLYLYVKVSPLYSCVFNKKSKNSTHYLQVTRYRRLLYYTLFNKVSCCIDIQENATRFLKVICFFLLEFLFWVFLFSPLF